jgi:hypothetical protein
MRRLNILRSRAFWLALTLVVFVASLYFFKTLKSKGLPATVAIHGELSKLEAEALYTSNNRMLYALYWRRLQANVSAGQFKELWLNIRRGPERINNLSKDSDGWFVVNATNRLGNSCTIRSRGLGAPRLAGVHKVQPFTVQGGVVVSAGAQPLGAADRSQPVVQQTNGTSATAGSDR